MSELAGRGMLANYP